MIRGSTADLDLKIIELNRIRAPGSSKTVDSHGARSGGRNFSARGRWPLIFGRRSVWIYVSYENQLKKSRFHFSTLVGLHFRENY